MAGTKNTSFSLMYLKQLLSQKTEIISEELSTCFRNQENIEKCEEILKSKLEPKDLVIILALVTNAPWSVLESAKINILDHLISNEFFDSIIRFLTNIVENNCYNKDEFFALVRFYEVMITNVPICEETYQKFLTLFEMSFKCLEKFVMNSPIEILLFERMGELVKLLLFKVYYITRNDWHYSYMNVYPSPVDFYEYRNLMPNNVKGPYESVDQYLDIHFKILKEDFVCAVREGINQLRSEISGAKTKKNSSIYLYQNVSSIGISIDKSSMKSKIYHTIVFNEEDHRMLQEENFQITKKFMTGSLLFFTRNDFTTFVVATVEDNGDRDDNRCRIFRGIKVSLIGNPYQLKIGANYNMIEPVTFFEPYFQTLTTLKSMNPNNFPLMKNIVFTDMQPVPSVRKFALGKSADLNPSQLAALEAALSQKFTIIQGPPGTGKSYLARAIINCLINSRNPANYPILVVCVRNNALDLVLEPLVGSRMKIVRLGSQSKSEILTELTLRKLRNRWISCDAKQLLLTKIKQFRKIILAKENINCPEAIEEAVQGYTAALDSLNSLLQYYDARQLISGGVHVIGATTAGAARYHRMLSYIKPRVVIIEEAAEVMEPIIVSSIPEGCDHVILIGDHLQLQPTPAWHPSTIKYNLNISLFERMINNGMEYHQLKEQHRMRPEIAALISPLIYEDLLNHPSVCNYPDIKGMAKNIFFMDHSVKENLIEDDSESHWNLYEADFLIALATYLVKQGYDPSVITILATYSAQHQYMKKECQRFPLEGLQVQVVDNYQGEENDIVLLSLVRSKSPTVGFLNKMNRINVALSRAKQGLFIIGNMSTLSACSEGWNKITNILKSQDAIDNTLPLKCQTHQKITKVSKPMHLYQNKYGGCDSLCRFKMECGHVCSYPCHPSPALHEGNCSQQCLRLRKCGHKCNAKCFEECETKPCTVKETILLPCDHSVKLKCSVDWKQYKCIEPCKKLRQCGHACKGKCFEDCDSIPCKFEKDYSLSCGHSATLECSFNFIGYQCIEPCKKLLSCGRHRCQFPCYKECGPWPCKERVLCKFPCGHTSLEYCCGISSYKCVQPCSKMSPCGMHKCRYMCYEVCGPCKELVPRIRDCGHVVHIECYISKRYHYACDISGRCLVEVAAVSEYCKHTYYQHCYERKAGIKYKGLCARGCPQNPDQNQNQCSIL